MNKLHQESTYKIPKSIKNNLIAGIYNYCDRWCERCQFKDNCEIYQKEEKTEDINDNYKRASNILALTIEMLNDIAEDIGVDLNSLENIDMPENTPGEIEKLANNYADEIIIWLKENKDFFYQKTENLFSNNEEVSQQINEVIKVLSWYAPLIGAKINRAMYNSVSEQDTDQYDKLGSAKIAIISIDKSIDALSYCLKNFPEKEEECLIFLSDLSKIKRLLKTTYPKVMEFKRPGFDD